MSRLQVLLLIALAGCSSPARSETISFDEVAPGTIINGETINGVLFDFKPTSADCQSTMQGPSPSECPVGDEAFVYDLIGATNFSGNSLFLPGEFSTAFGPMTPAVLTLTFINGPVNTLGFQYAIEFPNANATLDAGTVFLYDTMGSLITSSLLHAPFNIKSHAGEGTFSYSGRPVSRAVVEVSNLLDFDTTPAIDTITYQAVPEPGTVGVVSIGICALVWVHGKRLRKRRKRDQIAPRVTR